MKLNTHTLTTLAAGFAAGNITESYIRENFGDSAFGQVAALVGGGVVGSVVGGAAHGLIGEALKTVDDHTGLVSMADDVIDSLNPFKW